MNPCKPPPILPPDPIGDALCDCYTFLLRKMAEKEGSHVAILARDALSDECENPATGGESNG